MKPLEVTTEFRRYDKGSEYMDHWTACIERSDGRSRGFGRGPTRSEAIKSAVDSYFKVRVVEDGEQR